MPARKLIHRSGLPTTGRIYMILYTGGGDRFSVGGGDRFSVDNFRYPPLSVGNFLVGSLRLTAGCDVGKMLRPPSTKSSLRPG